MSDPVFKTRAELAKWAGNRRQATWPYTREAIQRAKDDIARATIAKTTGATMLSEQLRELAQRIPYPGSVNGTPLAELVRLLPTIIAAIEEQEKAK